MQPLKNWIKRNFADLLYGGMKDNKRKEELLKRMVYLDQMQPLNLSDWAFDVFTYHGEDGIITHLIQVLKNVPHTFVDIGAGNCIIGNCSTQAIHFGWRGVFIDKDRRQLSTGKRFYSKTTAASYVSFINEEITPENVDRIIADSGMKGELGLLSVDIDGNDYWVWKAIDAIQPRIVVIEAKVEFGLHDVIVPYGEMNHRSKDSRYNGASVEAFRKLGVAKGYKLIGANKQGYNLFFVRNNEPVAGITTKEALWHPDAKGSFYPGSFFNEYKFVTE